MFNNIKFPALIISSPRTGSTILGDYISQIHPHIEFFCEPHLNNNLNNNHYDEFLEYSKNSKDFILKIHAQDLHHYNINLKDFYLIRLRRRDIINQIASWYLADIRNKFGGYDPDSLEYRQYTESAVRYDGKSLDSIIDSVLRANEYLNRFDHDPIVSLDQDLWYEDLNFDLNKVNFDVNDLLNRKHRVFKTPLPTNYDMLKKIISIKLDNKSG
jgi:LPS sulfotransferase NodH